MHIKRFPDILPFVLSQIPGALYVKDGNITIDGITSFTNNQGDSLGEFQRHTGPAEAMILTQGLFEVIEIWCAYGP